MELLIDKLIDILKDIFNKDGLDLNKALTLIVILVISVSIWKRKLIIPTIHKWIKKITQAEKVATLDKKVKRLEDVAFRPLQELERRNREFRLDIEDLISHTQSLFDQEKITKSSRDNTVCKLQSLQTIYEESIEDLLMLSEELSNDISASRQSLIDAHRWANEEGFEAFQAYKRQQKNSKP